MSETDIRNTSCEARISAELDGRIDSLHRIFNLIELELDEFLYDVEENDVDTGEPYTPTENPLCTTVNGTLTLFDNDGDVVDLPDEIDWEFVDGQLVLSMWGSVVEDPADVGYRMLDEYPLWVTVKRTMVVGLSTGGPGDQFEVDIDEHGNMESHPIYRFLDWWDGATRQADNDVVEKFLDYFAQIVDPK